MSILMTATKSASASLSRLLCIGVTLFLVLMAGPSAAFATQGGSANPQDKVDQFLTLLADPAVQSFITTKQVVPVRVASGNPIIVWLRAVHSHIHDARLAVPLIPQEFQRSANALTGEFDGQTSAGVKLVALLMAVLLVEWLISRSLSRWKTVPFKATSMDLTPQSAPAVLSMLTLIAPSVISGALAIALFMAFDWTSFQLGILLPVMIALIAGRVLFGMLACTSFSASKASESFAGDIQSGFWRRRAGVLIVLLLVTWLAGELMETLQFEPNAADAVIDLAGIVILIACCEIAWRRSDREGNQRSRLKVWLQVSWLCCLWVLWVAGAYLAFWVGVYVLVIPTVLSAASSLARRNNTDPNMAEATAPSVRMVLLERATRAVMIALAVGWLAIVARSHPTALTENVLGAQIMSGVMEGIVALIAADLVWQVAKAYMNYHLERSANVADTEAIARSSRLATLLPLLRSVVAVMIAVIAVLTVLSGMGIAIGPLLAGAGIFGVALGFGSQTLVKDVIGGIFYMVDDAFRVGEYIQSGHYKGTVESFSIRSVKLRHHRGPVFIVPFGSLGAVENMSRDWVIDKFTVTVGYETKLDEVKTLVKAIGVELQVDPELGPVIIETLKMKGVESFGDNGIDVSFALMTKPGSQTQVRRRALVMIRDAFEANGIDFASRTTHGLLGDKQNIGLEPTSPAATDRGAAGPSLPRPAT